MTVTIAPYQPSNLIDERGVHHEGKGLSLAVTTYRYRNPAGFHERLCSQDSG